MGNSIDLVIFQVKNEAIAGVCNLLEDYIMEDPETGEEVFDVTYLSGPKYFEFAKLPDGEPIVRTRIAGNQVWTEDKKNLPKYVSDMLIENSVPYQMSHKRRMPIEQFIVEVLSPLELRKEDIAFEYK